MFQPQFTITNKILRTIGVIEGCKQVIDHAPLLPYYEKKFQEEALVRAVHYGTHIEGNELNFNQAEKVMLGEEIVARERDVQEVINYRRVMEFIGESTENSRSETARKEVTEELILKIHLLTVEKILPPERCGVYRKSQVVIKNNQTGEVTFTPPPFTSIPEHMVSFLSFLNVSTDEDIHPVLRSGIVHYEFVRIHPFIDGNGRVARALSTLLLFREGYDIRKFFSLEEYFDKNAKDYYEALKAVAKMQGDLTAWLEYFTEGLAIELTKIREKIEHISIDSKMKEKLGGKPLLLSDRQLAIIEYIQKTGYLQNNAFKQLFPFVSEDTVLNELKSLISSNLIKKVGKTKAAKYIMS